MAAPIIGLQWFGDLPIPATAALMSGFGPEFMLQWFGDLPIPATISAAVSRRVA